MLIKLAGAMAIVFILLPLIILFFIIIVHMICILYLELKEDIEELR